METTPVPVQPHATKHDAKAKGATPAGKPKAAAQPAKAKTAAQKPQAEHAAAPKPRTTARVSGRDDEPTWR